MLRVGHLRVRRGLPGGRRVAPAADAQVSDDPRPGKAAGHPRGPAAAPIGPNVCPERGWIAQKPHRPGRTRTCNPRFWSGGLLDHLTRLSSGRVGPRGCQASLTSRCSRQSASRSSFAVSLVVPRRPVFTVLRRRLRDGLAARKLVPCKTLVGERPSRVRRPSPLPKLDVAGSNPVARSVKHTPPRMGLGPCPGLPVSTGTGRVPRWPGSNSQSAAWRRRPGRVGSRPCG